MRPVDSSGNLIVDKTARGYIVHFYGPLSEEVPSRAIDAKNYIGLFLRDSTNIGISYLFLYYKESRKNFKLLPKEMWDRIWLGC